MIVLVARAVWPQLSSAEQARQAGFWSFGAVRSLLPLTAAGPSDRNLCFVGLGIAPLLALALERLLMQPKAASAGTRAVLGTLAMFNLALAPLLLPIKCMYMQGLEAAIAPAAASIPRDADSANKTLAVATSPSEGPVSVTWWQRDALAIARPRAARHLVTTFGETYLTRVDAVTLRLHRDGGFFEGDMHTLARGRSRPFRGGDVVELSDMKATILEVTADDRPLTIEFRFGASLESPH